MNVTTTVKTLCTKRVFSGIQPTGIPHLGNYFGAIAQWLELTSTRASQSETDKNNIDYHYQPPIFSIVDVHAYTSGQTHYGPQLYSNILSTTASLIALGLDIDRCILFRQSDLFEHNYLDNVLHNFVSSARLSHMTQFKAKSRESSVKTITSGLLNYPVLQAADILLYKAELVPVGEDQLQHIELTRDIAKKFNTVLAHELFTLPEPLLNPSNLARRIKSLMDPNIKMSKSDVNKRAFIQVIDEPDVILNKCKRALTDCTSAVFFEPNSRPGVSNLMTIYHLATGRTFDEITEEFKGVETAQFKLRLADVLIEKFRPARSEFKLLINNRDHLEKVLKLGASKAQPIALETVNKVKHLMGSYRTSMVN